MRIKFICEEAEIRLSEELKKHVSRKLYKNIKSSGAIIYVNGEPLEAYKFIKRGDEVYLDYEREKEISWPLYEASLDIRYEDDSYLVIFKPEGLLSIPTKAEPRSVYQEVLYYLASKGLEPTVSILNRLDKDTRGLMVIAKNRLAAYNLQPTHEKMDRRYLCMLEGKLGAQAGRIVNYIKKGDDGNKRIITKEDDIAGKLAISNYRVIKEYEDKSLVEFILETGRTHQIRVHFSHLNHPLLGDELYGGDKRLINRVALHSYRLEFIHPVTNEKITLVRELPFDMKKLM